MKVDVLLGLQWGDEGKGKIVDVLTPNYDIIARFQGGPNAGHTLEFNNIKHVLHTIPSGIFRNDAINIIGNGVVIDPVILREELQAALKLGARTRTNLYISKKAQLILPSHRMLDKAYEQYKGNNKIGSTQKGIGPTYTDKTARIGLRIGDIFDPRFREKYFILKEHHKKILASYSYYESDQEYEKAWFDAIEFLRGYNYIDSEIYVNNALKEGKTVLAEGAQGSMLDLDFGSYPFVTSSNTLSSGVCSGLGVAPNKIGKVYGIVKAYCTRVGSGPFPTELNDEIGAKLQTVGNEFGATTGRPRRCGWLDLVALKYAIMLNGVTDLIITKADVLSGFDTIKVATSYKVNGQEIDHIPYDVNAFIEPVYTELKGWRKDLSSYNKEKQMPETLIEYLKFIARETGVRISYLSVGPNRNQTIPLNIEA